MPSKMAKFCREKGVLITMYEEMPRKRRVSGSQSQPQHHPHPHQHHNYLHHASEGKEYNRRADLLRYSERLREFARPVESTISQSNPTPPNKQQPPNETIAVLKKKNSARTLNCLGDCKILIPSCIRSLTSPKGKKDRKKKKQSGSTTNKMKALMKSFQEQKNRGFIPRMFSKLRKRR